MAEFALLFYFPKANKERDKKKKETFWIKIEEKIGLDWIITK